MRSRQGANMAEPSSPVALRRRLLLLVGGAAVATGVAFLPGVASLEPGPRATAAVAAMTAWCWLTVALPLSVTALLPALLLPATGAMKASEVAPAYFHDILLLFLGGFILARALERYGLHRRFALWALGLFGSRPGAVVLGFMAVAAVLSMFISNTATSIMMLPVALAVLDRCQEEEGRRLATPMLLGIAYACSMGGLATPIGTAPNAFLLGLFQERFPEGPEVSFGTWMLGVLPFVLVFLVLGWLVLTRVAFRAPRGRIAGFEQVALRRQELGPRSPEENRVLAVFGLVVVLWLTRKGVDLGPLALPGWQSLLPGRISGTLSDATVALFGAILLFILPGKAAGTRALLNWDDCHKVPWGILILLGGGFALSHAFESSGLSAAIGRSLQDVVSSLPPWLLCGVVALVVTFVTEITSNTATITVLLPLLFSAARAAELHPMLLALPATLAASCAFMLPVATPPNAILFSSGRLTVPQMAKAGILLNLASAVLLTAAVLLWIAPSWGLDLGTFPEWAR